MAGNLTDTAEARTLDWLNPDVAVPTRPTSPLKVRLMTANGSDSAAGTEVTGGGYTPQSLAFPAASGTTSTSNSGALNFTNMPACTVVGLEIWDSAGTPVRLWWGPLTGNATKTFAGGETFQIAAGQLTASMD